MGIPQEWLQYAPKPKPLKEGKTWNVFLSYRSVNRSWVLNLYDVLTEIGHKVFLDQYVLKAGDKLIEILQEGLEKTEAGILIWSSATRDSVWVNDEYETLQRKANEERDFTFVPIRLDNTKLPAFAANRIYVDFIAYPDGPNGGELLRLLWAITGSELPGEAVNFANKQADAAADAAASVVAAINNGKAEKLVQLFEKGGLPWKTSSALGCKAAEGLIDLEKYDEAIAMLDKLQDSFTKSLRPQQLKALAHARRSNEGDLGIAEDILGELYVKNHLDPETMGIYARTWMDKYIKSGEKNTKALVKSRNLYVEAFEKAPDDYYTGINAAAKSILIGTDKDLKKGLEYAASVEKIVGTREVRGDYWKTATVAEIFLINKKYAEAADMYEKAIAISPNATSSHKTTQSQASRLMNKLGTSDADREMVLAAFKA